MRRQRTAVVVAAVAALIGSPTAASAHDDDDDGDDRGGVTTIARGLDGPRQLNDFGEDRFLVAESDTGEVSSVDRESGEVTTLLTVDGFVQGVDFEDGLLFVAVGAPGPGQAARGVTAKLLVAKPDGTILDTIDLLAFERANNPDGQPQFDDQGRPFDTLSNPFSVEAESDRVLVADAAANAVLAIDRSGNISTFFVPPLVSPDEVPACADAQANPGVVGCDPVPTGVEEGEDGRIYVSTLGAEVPGAARVFVLSPEGDVLDVIEGLTSATGIAVAEEEGDEDNGDGENAARMNGAREDGDEDDGDGDGRRATVYVSELLEGAPQLPPPPGLDLSTIGQIVRIDADGTRSVAQVTMPIGLEIEDGELFSTAWSIAGVVGLPGRGEIVEVDDDAFREAAA